jgi:hypothetical protein
LLSFYTKEEKSSAFYEIEKNGTSSIVVDKTFEVKTTGRA